MTVTESPPDALRPKPRCFHPTPDRVVLVLLAAVTLLWLSDHFGWSAWHKGYAVLTAVASVGVVFLLMLAWFAASLMLRWRFQFGIRALLILGVAVGVPCSWLAVEMKKAAKQREAVEALKRFPYRIHYDHELPRNTRGALAPEAMRRLLGIDFFANIEFVCLAADENFTDAEVAHLESLPKLRELFLGSAAITDAGLKHLAGLTQLQKLGIGYTRVSDAGLEHLVALTHLDWLGMEGTGVTDEGVTKLQQALPNCKIER